MRGKLWSEHDDIILSEIYSNNSQEDIINTLNITWPAIKSRSRKLGLYRDQSRCHPIKDLNTRFHEHINRNSNIFGHDGKYPTECWIWIDRKNLNCYATLRNDFSEMVGAHRCSYELYIGKIPEGLVLDHLCKVHACVNPQHLEPVTTKENILRGIGPPSKNFRKTYCINGHLLFGDNLYIQPSTKYRYCRQCKRDSEKRCRKRNL